jgi:hypothetical protein
MKKLLVALVALFPLAAFAQSQPSKLSVGTLELAGDTNLSFLSADTTFKANGGSVSGTETTWNLRGLGLFYVTPNVGVGGTLSYVSDDTSVTGFKLKTDTFAIGPVVGLEFPVAPQIDLFGRASLVYASRTFDTGTEFKSSGFGFGLEAGAKYFIVKSVSLDGALVFQYLSLTSDSTPGFDITSTGFGVNLGVSIYFDTK